MKLTTNTNVSVDGVMQGLGGPEEDRRAGFERGGWAMPYFDEETAALIGQVYQRADAFLFGRRTYEVFAGSWGTGSWGANEGDNPISVALNTKPKYVASTTLTDAQWADTTVLSGDVAAAIGELKAKRGGELQVHGSGALVSWLLDNQLVDEITLLVYPVVVGQGTRLFPDTGPDAALDLVDSRSTPSGVSIQVYRPTGRARSTQRPWPTEAAAMLTWNRSGRGWRSCRSSSSRASTTGCTPSSPASSSASSRRRWTSRCARPAVSCTRARPRAAAGALRQLARPRQGALDRARAPA